MVFQKLEAEDRVLFTSPKHYRREAIHEVMRDHFPRYEFRGFNTYVGIGKIKSDNRKDGMAGHIRANEMEIVYNIPSDEKISLDFVVEALMGIGLGSSAFD